METLGRKKDRRKVIPTTYANGVPLLLAVNKRLLYALVMQNILRRIPPKNIIKLRRSSEELRRQLIDDYLTIQVTTCQPRAVAKPPFLEDNDIIASHIMRSRLELEDDSYSKKAPLYRCFVRNSIGDYRPSAESAALTEICIGTIAEVLELKPRLQVAAGFFSTMVAAVDDYIDREGTYKKLGEDLVMISHAYRDLMDMALEAELLKKGTLTKEELFDVKLALFEVISTLISSEDIKDDSRESAAEYLYRKSCGDKVVDVLLAASKADEETGELCRNIGRLTGEAGQLLDDVMDYKEDLACGKRNFIIMTASTMASAIDIARDKIRAARVLAETLPSDKNKGSLIWILETLDEVAAILARKAALGKGTGQSALNLSASLVALLGKAIPSNTFLMWF